MVVVEFSLTYVAVRTIIVIVCMCLYIYGFIWKCWVNLPNEIAIFHRDNDQQNHWVQWGTQHFQTHPYSCTWVYGWSPSEFGMPQVIQKSAAIPAADPRKFVRVREAKFLFGMDWFTGKFVGNQGFPHEIWGFPVNFPLNQSIDVRNGGIVDVSDVFHGKLSRLPVWCIVLQDAKTDLLL